MPSLDAPPHALILACLPTDLCAGCWAGKCGSSKLLPYFWCWHCARSRRRMSSLRLCGHHRGVLQVNISHASSSRGARQAPVTLVEGRVWVQASQILQVLAILACTAVWLIVCRMKQQVPSSPHSSYGVRRQGVFAWLCGAHPCQAPANRGRVLCRDKFSPLQRIFPTSESGQGALQGQVFSTAKNVSSSTRISSKNARRRIS